ncbi:MAG: hypothetical protein ABIJ97_13520 [Bacteroidota bacterium]
MKNIFFIAGLLAIVFISCQKEDPIPYIPKDDTEKEKVPEPISYEYDDFITAGERMVYNVDESGASVLDGDTIKENALWSFSVLTGTYTDTLEAMMPLLDPNGSDFPEATLAVVENKMKAFFAYSSKEKVEVLGVADTMMGQRTSIPFSNTMKFASFPIKFGAEFEDIVRAQVTQPYDTSIIIFGFPVAVDSIRYTMMTEVISSFNAWGRIVLNADTIPCLREARQEIRTADLEIHTTLGWFPSGTSTDEKVLIYNFYAREFGLPVAEVTMDMEKNISKVRYLKEYTGY